MYKNVALIALLAILVSGCQSGSSALDEAATIVAETVTARPPTATPTAKSTPLPSDTPKPLPTAKPIIALTNTVEAASVLSDLDVYVGANSDVPYQDGYIAWHQTEPVTIDMTGPQKDEGILQAINENLNAKNFIFKSKVTWNASGILICGVTFRSEPDINKGKQYQFYFYRLSGLPAYKIDVYDLGRFKNTISDIKYSDGMDSKNGSSNEFVLITQDNHFIVIINGKQQGQFYDNSKQREDGVLAFLGWQDSGKGSCTFENSWLWVLP